MGYKIPDVKADIHRDLEVYFNSGMWRTRWKEMKARTERRKMEEIKQDVHDLVDKHFNKIER